jgi:hypothetical protein
MTNQRKTMSHSSGQITYTVATLNQTIRNPCRRRIPPEREVSHRNTRHATEQTFSSSFSSFFSSTAGALPAAAVTAAGPTPPPPPPEGTYILD